MKKMQQGFTLIELMIVVAIIAILAAIAIPQYQNYIVRSQVTRAMGEAGQLKTVVEDCMNNGNTSVAEDGCVIGATGSSILTGNAQSGETLPTGTGVPQVTIAATANTATIIATFGNSASTRLTQGTAGTLTWTRANTGTWTCTTTVPAQFAPAGCPNGA